jgi:hypothetical protein
VWCGDTFIGTIGRVRQHHVKDPTVAHTYRLCSSKAPAREAFQAKCQAALDEKIAKKRCIEELDEVYRRAG